MSEYGAWSLKKEALQLNEESAKESIRELLRNNALNVTFTKVNGSERKMICTLNGSLVPLVPADPDKPVKARAPRPDVCTVWDLEADGWRSFRFDSITDVSFSVEQNKEFGLL